MSTPGRFWLSLGLLVAVYLATLASARPADVVAAIVIGTGTLVLLRRFLRAPDPDEAFAEPGRAAPPLARRVLAFGPFAAIALWDVLKGTWAVSLIVLRLRRRPRPGIVGIPIGARSPLGVAVSSLVTTLAPGTVMLDVDWDAGVIWLHVLDATDPESVRRSHQVFYERYQRRVFP